jgi:predicted nucleic acid-binding protein
MSDADAAIARCFVDSNIWLYAFIESQDKDKSARAKQVIQDHDVVVSTQIINEVCVNMLKKAKLPETEELRERHQFSFWDSLIVACALAEGATILYSEDMDTSLVVEKTLKIVNPLVD